MKVTKLLSLVLVALLAVFLGISCGGDDGGGGGPNLNLPQGASSDWGIYKGWGNQAASFGVAEATDAGTQVMKVTWSHEKNLGEDGSGFGDTEMSAALPTPAGGKAVYGEFDGFTFDFKFGMGDQNLSILFDYGDNPNEPWFYKPSGWINAPSESNPVAWKTYKISFDDFEPAGWGRDDGEYSGTIQQWFKAFTDKEIKIFLRQGTGTERIDDVSYFKNIGFYKGNHEYIIWYPK